MSDYVQDAVSAMAIDGREPMGAAPMGNLGYDDQGYGKLVQKMNMQAADPALMPHLARPGVLNPEPYGGAPGGVRVPMDPKPNDPAAGYTMAMSKLIHPSKSWNENFYTGGQ